MASATLNETGEVVRFWSSELPEEEKTVDEYRADRFEFAFIKVPFAMQMGTIVKNVITGNYGRGRTLGEIYMDMERKTFTLSDLDEAFWEKALTVSLEHSSGPGGWGCLWIVTSEKREYFIGFEGFPYNEYHLEEFSPLFRGKGKVTDYKHPYEVEDKGWKYIYKEGTLVRDPICRNWLSVRL